MRAKGARARTRRGAYCVYMVRCSDGTYYAGATNDLDARVERHNAGQGAKYLRGKGPVQVVYVKGYRYYKRALQAERWLKKRSRQEKETLIQEYGRVAPKISSPAAPKSIPGASRTSGDRDE